MANVNAADDGQDKSWVPTRKWMAAFALALAAFVINWVSEGSFDKPVLIALIGLLGQSVASYFVPNANYAGGVPPKK